MELNTARGRLFLFIALVVSLPLLNYNLHFIESAGLEGVSPKKECQPFSPDNWWEGKFQEQHNTLINDSIEFRPDLVRLTNQVDYWLFHKANAEKVILGYDGQLFGKMYVEEYNTVRPIPDSTILALCIKLKKIQDTMDKQGKTFIMGYSPSKPYLYPDKIPHYLRRKGARMSNYLLFRHYGDSLHLRQIDYNQWFAGIAYKSPYPLMPQQGVHWSWYGSALGIDSFVKFVERERKVKLPRAEIREIKVSDSAKAPDADLGGILNLIAPLPKEKLAYPLVIFHDSVNTVKPKTIFVGDSYFWLWLSGGFPNGMSKDWEFWDHFSDVWNHNTIAGQEEVKHIDTYNWQDSLNKSDCVLLMYNPTNYHELLLRNGFLDAVYNYYYPAKKK